MRKMYKIDNLCCPNCAKKIQEEIKKIDGVRDCILNYLAQKMILEFDLKNKSEIMQKILLIAKEISPEFIIID